MAWQMSWAYIAGFLDGEGTIRHKHEKTGYARFRIYLYQCRDQAEVLYEIQEFLAERAIYGKILEVKSRNRIRGECHLQIEGAKNVMKFLKRVEPHLRVKRRSANEAMAHFEELRQNAISTQDMRCLRAYVEGYEPRVRRKVG